MNASKNDPTTEIQITSRSGNGANGMKAISVGGGAPKWMFEMLTAHGSPPASQLRVAEVYRTASKPIEAGSKR